MSPETENEGLVRLWDLANRCWDLGDYITAFAVGQTILVSMSLGTSKDFRTGVFPMRKGITVVVVVGLVLYLVGIWICYRREILLRSLAAQGQEYYEVARSGLTAVILRAGALTLSHAVTVGALLVQKQNP